MFARREQYALPTGISAKVLAARTRKKLDAIRKLLLELKGPWEDVYPPMEMYTEELLGHFEEFEKLIAEAVEYLQGEPGT